MTHSKIVKLQTKPVGHPTTAGATWLDIQRSRLQMAFNKMLNKLGVPRVDFSDFSSKHGVAVIRPFDYEDPENGGSISLTVSPLYSMLTINGIKYYFIRETAEFDGISVKVRPDGPILIYDAEWSPSHAK